MVTSQAVEIKFKRLAPEARLPQRMTAESIGLDLSAFLLTDTGRPNTLLIPPRTVRNVPTGLMVQPPPDHYLTVCSRSGLAKDRTVFVANAPGIIDPDYRGELFVLLYNGGNDSYYVRHEERIAQLLVSPVVYATCTPIKDLTTTVRGPAGLGSTGR